MFSMAENPQAGGRFHGLDLLRGLAMTLGIFIHAPLVYVIPDLAGLNRAEVPEPSIWLLLMVGWIHQWRMPMFFILAGFFGLLILRRRGLKYYVSDRFIRVFLAMLAFGLAVNLLFGTPVVTLYHLWFLYYLFAMSLLLAIGFWASQFLDYGRLAGFARRLALEIGPAAYIMPLLLVVTPSSGTNGVGHAPETLMEFEFRYFVYYFAWFILGCMIYDSPRVIESLRKPSAFRIWLLSAVVFQFVVWFWIEYGDDEHLALKALGCFVTFCWCMGLMGLACRFINQPHRLLNALIESSYPIYLVHLVPAVYFGLLFVEHGVEQHLAVSMNIVATSVASVAAYWVLIKYTPLNWLVNGYAKSSFKIWRLR